MESYIQNKGQYQTSINGDVIDNTKWNMVYDGDELDLEAERNNEAIYMKLNNNDIMKLLEVPSHHKPIRERLEFDLQPENQIDIRPIIMEELEQMSSPHHVVKKRKARKTRKAKQHSKGKHHSHSKSKRHSHSRSKSTSKSTSKSMAKHHNKSVTPDFMKTIY
jgi:hypothetical protein